MVLGLCMRVSVRVLVRVEIQVVRIRACSMFYTLIRIWRLVKEQDWARLNWG